MLIPTAEMHTNPLKFLMTKSSRLKDAAKLVGVSLFIKISCLLMGLEFGNHKKINLISVLMCMICFKSTNMLCCCCFFFVIIANKCICITKLYQKEVSRAR